MALMPFDYAATFQLAGEPGRVHEDVISISPESPFIAYAVSYGLEEERGRPVTLQALPDAPVRAGDLTLGNLPLIALIDGVRFNPRERLPGAGPGVGPDGSLFDREYTPAAAPRLLQRVKPPEEVAFLFSLIDTASGRELQDEPANNLASLGSSRGGRPFRLLARPLEFQPRSTIRVQVIERSQDVRGALFIVLQGYKRLGRTGPAVPGARPLRRSVPPRTPRPGRGMVPFDYVVSLDLDGLPGSVVSEEITISVDGAFVATHIGYGLEAGPTRAVPVRLPAGDGDVALNNLTLRSFPESALIEGIRIRPDYHRIALQNGGALAAVRPALVGQIFESLNRPEDVQFRYSIFDGGRGRELQDRPLFNLAGLGAADGDRPFKRLPSPLVFLPRSTLRVSVEERFGRGTLYFALQGYKTAARGSRQ